jgi:hypothetical protein
MILDRLISEPRFHFVSFVLLNVVRTDFSNRYSSEERNKGTLERVSLDPLLGELVVRYYILFEPLPGKFLEGNILPGRGTIYALPSRQPLAQKQFIDPRPLPCVFRTSFPVSFLIELEVRPP